MSRCLCTDCFSRIKDMRKLLYTEERFNTLANVTAKTMACLIRFRLGSHTSCRGCSRAQIQWEVLELFHAVISCIIHHSQMPSEVEELTSRDLEFGGISGPRIPQLSLLVAGQPKPRIIRSKLDVLENSRKSDNAEFFRASSSSILHDHMKVAGCIIR